MKLRHYLSLTGLVFFLLVFGLIYTGIIDINYLDLKSKIDFLPFLIVAAAFLDSINPCAFSVLFITLAFLFSLGQSRSQIIKTGLVYVLGIFLTYILIGLGILKVLTIFNIPNSMAKIGAIIIILFGAINMINEFFPKFPIKLKLPDASHNKVGELITKATIPAAFILGLLVGMFEFPCTGGPYLLVLGLLHDEASFMRGFWYLVLYNIIFVLPLLIAIFISTDKPILEKLDKLRRMETKRSRIWVSLIVIALGLVVFLI
jgi:cytochrome c biogenesis protein CcdA